MKTINDVINALEGLAPLAYAEDFDNVGLLVGDRSTHVTGVLITHDALEAVVDEAIEKGCNMIVSFHPIIFKGIKRFNGQDYVNRVVIKAIKNDIAIYATHTALDNVQHGVNATICNQLGLQNRHSLLPKSNYIYKLTTYVPNGDLEKVRQHLFDAGAGNIGNYEECSFGIEGEGSFKGKEGANPTVGKVGELERTKEVQLNVIFERHLQGAVLKALFESHSYEEVAYEVVKLENTHQKLGMGMIGELDEAMSEEAFLSFLKQNMNTECVRHSECIGKPIKKVAVLGGSGSFAIGQAKKQKADAYVTADLKYHDFYQAEKSILLCDIGHYESEQYTKSLLYEFFTEKNTKFAVVLSDINTNPVNYF